MNDIDELKIFCANFKQIREILILSKQQMSKLLNVSVATVTGLENGLIPRRVGVNLLLAIYENFEIAPAEMFCRFLANRKFGIFPTFLDKFRSP